MTVYADRPAILDPILAHRLAVVEASAGTGKTWTIERLVVDLVLGRGGRPPLELDEILVVTFTDRATRELQHRIRTMLERLARQDASDPDAAADPARAWHLDEAARRRLDRARFRFDSAPISTIHGFCQRVLVEDAIEAGGRLSLAVADGRAGIEQALRDRLPSAAVEPGVADAVLAFFEDRGDTAVDQLVDRIVEARRVGWSRDDVQALTRARVAVERQLEALDLDALQDAVDAWGRPDLVEQVAGLRDVAPDERPGVWRGAADVWLDALMTKGARSERKRIPDALRGLGPTIRAAVQLGDPELALDERLVPDTLDDLRALRLERGEVDFTDMLRRVADALEGDTGARLTASLRRRYRVAIVDEFQDTDDVQWSIFERVFAQSEDHGLIVIGDPKQAIYSFRGGDVFTWLEARRSLVARGGSVASLDRTWRSSVELTTALNTLLSIEAPQPIFSSPDITYAHPVRAGHAGWPHGIEHDGRPLAPVVALRLDTSGAKLDEARERWVAGLVEYLGRLLDEDTPAQRVTADGTRRPLRPSDVFVLTRSNAEVDTLLGALQTAGLPAVTLDRSDLMSLPEARGVRDVVRAIVDPWDPVARVRAFTTPVFGVPWDHADRVAALDPEHPLVEALESARQLVVRGRFDAAFAHVRAVGGFEARMLATRPDGRHLDRWRQVFDVVGLEARRRRVDPEGLVRLVEDLLVGREVPADESDRTPRAPAAADAITVMTMHASKGLQAPVVALYGGFRTPPTRGAYVVTHPAGARRVVPRPVADPEDLAAEKREAAEERERLLYVAMTRAAAQLIVPWAPEGSLGTRSRLTGAIAPLNTRLDDLHADGPADGIAVIDTDRDEARPVHASGASAHRDTLERLARAEVSPAAGRYPSPRPRVSYSSLKRDAAARGELDAGAGHDRVRLDPPPPDALPRGAAVGSALHRIAELAPMPAGEVSLASWRRDADVRAIVTESLARFGVDAVHADEAARLAYAALRTDLPIGDPGVDAAGAPIERFVGGVAAARRVLPEVEFFYPVRGPSGTVGTAIGYIDAVVDLDGRLLIVDYKSDSLPAWDAATVDAHVAEHYALQPLIYALGLSRWLGLTDRAAWDARIAGHAWIFFRGVATPGDPSWPSHPSRVQGVHTGRVTWDALVAFERDLAERLGGDR